MQNKNRDRRQLATAVRDHATVRGSVSPPAPSRHAHKSEASFKEGLSPPPKAVTVRDDRAPTTHLMFAPKEKAAWHMSMTRHYSLHFAAVTCSHRQTSAILEPSSRQSEGKRTEMIAVKMNDNPKVSNLEIEGFRNNVKYSIKMRR